LFPLCAFVLAACAPSDESETADSSMPDTQEIPDRIVMERGGFIPEGIEYDQTNRRFLTGSLTEGSIYEIHNDGSMTAFIEDDDLVSSVGIEVDEGRNRLLVANADFGIFSGEAQGQAKLGVYALDTGERMAMVDLAEVTDGGDDAVYFANDVTVADDGTVYVTDTRMNVVYAVDGNYAASVFYTFENAPGLNGIVHHPDGYLIVVGGGNLYKIPTANPSAMTQVQLAEPLEGSDGLVWAADGRLASVSNRTSSVVALTSADDWASAQVSGVATFAGQATTGAAVGDDIYVVQPHFNDDEPPVILRAQF
jgi:sugar lactone lactonase YvrE